MSNQEEIIVEDVEALELKTKRQVLALDGKAYVKAMTKLYNDLGEEIKKS